MDKAKYLLAKANGLLEELRGDEIDKRLRKRGYTHSKQIAIAFDKDTKPDEYEAYQALRAEVKAEVDADMAELEAQL